MASPQKTSFHPALAVTSIKNLIPLTLETENVQYSSWAELFKLTARAYDVLDHILQADSPSGSTTSMTSSSLSDDDRLRLAVEEKALWNRIDALVLQWIYGTISHELLHTILEPNSTAMAAWNRLADIFQDNKNARALHLEDQFSSTRLENFPSISAYCQALRTIATQLANVDSPVNDNCLVLRLVHGLPASYETVASFIQQTNPLPSFEKARSMLLLDESRRQHQLSTSSSPASALVSTAHNPPPPRPDVHAPAAPSYGSGPRGRGGARHPSSRGKGRGRSSGGRHSDPSSWSHTPAPSPWSFPPWAPWMPQYWNMPPCPYPTVPGNSTTPRSPTAGILGPRPQALTIGPMTSQMPAPHTATYVPTALPTAMHAMTLNPPDDAWYMDTGATSHMTSDTGSSYQNPNPAM
ncbi:unnamed protein product [Cuscuta epithymum]|uniref:Uncharacterized protein n=1 Tax=Cuscuta epithymum TaxID=186058 RepID=A0AAV0EEW8_9ASTE|nr:unnamed protein product [Cuscuta epithymum]